MTTIVLLLAGAALVGVGAFGLVLAWRDTDEARATTAPVSAAAAVAGGAVALVAGGSTTTGAQGAALALLVAVLGMAQVAVLHAASLDVRSRPALRRPAPALLGAMAVAGVAGAVLGAFGGDGGALLLGVEVLAAPIAVWAAASGRLRWPAWWGVVALSVEALGLGTLLAVAHDLRWSALEGAGRRGSVAAALVLGGLGLLGRLAVALVAARAASRSDR